MRSPFWVCGVHHPLQKHILYFNTNKLSILLTLLIAQTVDWSGGSLERPRFDCLQRSFIPSVHPLLSNPLNMIKNFRDSSRTRPIVIPCLPCCVSAFCRLSLQPIYVDSFGSFCRWWNYSVLSRYRFFQRNYIATVHCSFTMKFIVQASAEYVAALIFFKVNYTGICCSISKTGPLRNPLSFVPVHKLFLLVSFSVKNKMSNLWRQLLFLSSLSIACVQHTM